MELLPYGTVVWKQLWVKSVAMETDYVDDKFPSMAMELYAMEL